MLDMLEERVQFVAQVLRATLEQNDLYIAVDPKTEEFIFVDREAYHKNEGKIGRVKMNEINMQKY